MKPFGSSIKPDARLRDNLLSLAKNLGDRFDTVSWKTLDINYHPPRVERLWTQLGDYRFMVHRIHPANNTEALMHPHPWPSAVMIICGEYEHGTGYSETADIPSVGCVTVLKPGCIYEMTNPNGWHYVSPLKKPSISLMLIDKPHQQVHPFYQKEKHRLNPLTERDRKALIRDMNLALERLYSDGNW